MTQAVSIGREAAISIVINGVLSLAFFLGVFGTQPRLLNWAAPDDLALDFVPQSIAVALMSALVPALIARRKLAGALAHHAVSLRGILLRAALFAIAGAALGGVLAFSIESVGFPPIAWAAAMMIKIAYGGALGALVASLALRRLLSSARLV